MAFRRTPVKIFQLANPLYANAIVSFFAIDAAGVPTSTLIPLYTAATGSTQTANPQTLDSNGKLAQPTWFEAAFVARVGAGDVPSHQTAPWYPDAYGYRGAWVTGTLYTPTDTVKDPSSSNVYICLVQHTSGVFATDVAAGKFALFVDIGVGTVTQPYDTDLTAIAALSSTGLIARTGAGTSAVRTLTGTAAEITVTNGDGVAGAPAFSLPAALTFTGKTITGGTFASPTFTAPALGTPASGVATNLTGTASGLTAGNVTTNANLTGPITSVGNATSVASQTGTGSTFVMSAGPTLTGTAVAATLNATNLNGILGAGTPAAITGTTVKGTSGLVATGNSIPDAANQLVLAAAGGSTHYIKAYGADASTNGVLDVFSLRSDGSNAVQAFQITSTGVNASVIGASTPAAGTFTTVTANTSLNSATLNQTAAAGNFRGIFGQTAGVNRWQFGTNSDAEAGANAGSSWVLNGYSDAGSFNGTAISVARATNNVTFGAAVTAGAITGTAITAASTIIGDTSGHLGLRSYTVGTLPSAGTGARLIYVSDGTSNKRLAVSDGTNWRWPDGAIVS